MVTKAVSIKRTRIKRSKKSASQHRMVLALDAACRLRVFERDDLTCQRCGKRGGEWDKELERPVIIQWSHVHSRRHYCLRWDDDNSKAFCDRCHCWWGNNPGLAYDWFAKNFPERWERITRVLLLNPKIRVKDLYEELKSQGAT